MKKILTIGAHPDDIEISCLGYLLKENREKNQKYQYLFLAVGP